MMMNKTNNNIKEIKMDYFRIEKLSNGKFRLYDYKSKTSSLHKTYNEAAIEANRLIDIYFG